MSSRKHRRRFRDPGRSERGRSIYGNRADDTEAAHHLSFVVAKAALKAGPGRPVTRSIEDVERELNRDENLAIKRREMNRRVDHRRDKRIISALGIEWTDAF